MKSFKKAMIISSPIPQSDRNSFPKSFQTQCLLQKHLQGLDQKDSAEYLKTSVKENHRTNVLRNLVTSHINVIKLAKKGILQLRDREKEINDLKQHNRVLEQHNDTLKARNAELNEQSTDSEEKEETNESDIGSPENVHQPEPEEPEAKVEDPIADDNIVTVPIDIGNNQEHNQENNDEDDNGNLPVLPQVQRENVRHFFTCTAWDMLGIVVLFISFIVVVVYLEDIRVSQEREILDSIEQWGMRNEQCAKCHQIPGEQMHIDQQKCFRQQVDEQQLLEKMSEFKQELDAIHNQQSKEMRFELERTIKNLQETISRTVSQGKRHQKIDLWDVDYNSDQSDSNQTKREKVDDILGNYLERKNSSITLDQLHWERAIDDEIWLHYGLVAALSAFCVSLVVYIVFSMYYV